MHARAGENESAGRRKLRASRLGQPPGWAGAKPNDRQLHQTTVSGLHADLATGARRLLGRQQDLDDVATPGWRDPQCLLAANRAHEVPKLFGERIERLNLDRLV